MNIETKFNSGDKVWFFDKNKVPQNKEIKSVSFYSDLSKTELYYTMIRDNKTYSENELFNTQMELYSNLGE